MAQYSANAGEHQVHTANTINVKNVFIRVLLLSAEDIHEVRAGWVGCRFVCLFINTGWMLPNQNVPLKHVALLYCIQYEHIFPHINLFGTVIFRLFGYLRIK